MRAAVCMSSEFESKMGGRPLSLFILRGGEAFPFPWREKEKERERDLLSRFSFIGIVALLFSREDRKS